MGLVGKTAETLQYIIDCGLLCFRPLLREDQLFLIAEGLLFCFLRLHLVTPSSSFQPTQTICVDQAKFFTEVTTTGTAYYRRYRVDASKHAKEGILKAIV